MKILSSERSKFFKPNIETAAKIGIESKNDILLERLLMAVKTKLPNKTRFETALMYIEQAESSSEGPSLSSKRQ